MLKVSKLQKLFNMIIDYKDSKELKGKCLEMIEKLHNLERQMAEAFSKILEKALIRNSQISISAGYEHTVGLKSDGTGVTVGRECFVSG